MSGVIFCAAKADGSSEVFLWMPEKSSPVAGFCDFQTEDPTACLTRVLKAASMLVLGSVLLIACHLTFAFVLPMFKGNAVGGIIIAYTTILVLGASFSLVPASLWPSVPKLVDAKVIGSAYALIFWIQNIGLWLFPLLIGKVLDQTNPGVTDPTQFDYTAPLVMLASLGVAALILGFVLKVVDKKKGIGLELPNIQE